MKLAAISQAIFDFVISNRINITRKNNIACVRRHRDDENWRFSRVSFVQQNFINAVCNQSSVDRFASFPVQCQRVN